MISKVDQAIAASLASCNIRVLHSELLDVSKAAKSSPQSRVLLDYPQGCLQVLNHIGIFLLKVLDGALEESRQEDFIRHLFHLPTWEVPLLPWIPPLLWQRAFLKCLSLSRWHPHVLLSD